MQRNKTDSSERYDLWTPLPDIPSTLYVHGIHDDYEGTRFLLQDENPAGRILRVAFDSTISYRNVNESFRIKLLNAQGHIVSQASLFTVASSHWLDWLRAEAGGVLDQVRLVHYAIITGNDCIDIASEFPPVVEWLGE